MHLLVVILFEEHEGEEVLGGRCEAAGDHVMFLGNIQDLDRKFLRREEVRVDIKLEEGHFMFYKTAVGSKGELDWIGIG